jgi:hypothetical protein
VSSLFPAVFPQRIPVELDAETGRVRNWEHAVGIE